MKRSEIFYKVMSEFPLDAQESASEILKHLQEHDNLRHSGEDKKSPHALKTKKVLFDSIANFKKKYPDLINDIYQGFSKSSIKLKQLKYRQNFFIKNIMDIRMLTSSFTLADDFYDNCLQSESINYLKNKMMEGYVPSTYGDLTDDYRNEILKLAQSILFEFESNEKFHLSIIESYKKTMGWNEEESVKKATRLREIALLLKKDKLSVHKIH